MRERTYAKAVEGTLSLGRYGGAPDLSLLALFGKTPGINDLQEEANFTPPNESPQLSGSQEYRWLANAPPPRPQGALRTPLWPDSSSPLVPTRSQRPPCPSPQSAVLAQAELQAGTGAWGGGE